MPRPISRQTWAPRAMVPCCLLLLALQHGCQCEGPDPAGDFGGGASRSPADRGGHPLLGQERGIDHVGIAVGDLGEARRTYHERLGFGNPREGRLPNGILNVNFYFEDGTYLELLTHAEQHQVPWLAEFVARRTGALFLFLSVSSAERTASFLESRGVEVGKPVPGTIQEAGQKRAPKVMWHSLFPTRSPLPGNPISFIAYDPKLRADFLAKLEDRRVRRRHFAHPNTARGIKAVWMAVPDVAAAAAAYAAVGLPAGTEVRKPALAARGRAVRCGLGNLVLLQPQGQDGPVRAFLDERGPGIIGLTLEVHDLTAARLAIERGTSQKLAPAAPGSLGESLLVPPSLTHGVWIELVKP